MKPSASAGRSGNRGGAPARPGRGHPGGPVHREPPRPGRQPVPLAEQAQPGRGERGQVPGADRAVTGDRRGESAVDRVGQRAEHPRVHPGAARADLVQPDHQHGPRQFRGEQRPGPGGVTAQHVQPMLGRLAGGHGDVAFGTHPGGPAVHRALPGHLLSHLPRGPGGGPGGRAHLDPGLAPRHAGHLRTTERRPVDRDARLRHPLPQSPVRCAPLQGPPGPAPGPDPTAWMSQPFTWNYTKPPTTRPGAQPGAETGNRGIPPHQDRYDDRLMEVAPCLPSCPAAAMPPGGTGPSRGLAGRSRPAWPSPWSRWPGPSF